MSNITIGALALPGFNSNALGADISLSSLTVALGSPTVTGTFPARIVGLGGFKITLPDGVFDVESIETGTLTLTSNYTGAGGTVSATLHKFAQLRIYALASFTPSGSSEVVQIGAPHSSEWFRRYAASVINDGEQNVLYLPEIVLPATTDSTNPVARYFVGIYGPSGQFIKQSPVPEFRLDSTTTPTSWAIIAAFNSPPGPAPPSPVDFVTEQELNARFPTGLADELLYFESAGNVLSRLSLDPGDFQITAGVLEALNVTKQLQEEGSDLPIRNKINFVGSAYTASDDAGNDRTNVTADSDLNAIASNSTNGIYARTGTGTVSARTITGPAAGITVTNGDGVSGNPTLALANNLAALEAINTTGLIAQTGADTVTPRTLTGPAAGITVTNGGGVAGNPTLALADDLAALEGLGSTGIAARTAANTWAQRTITGTADQVTATNGDGVSGNPTISLPNTVKLGTPGGSPALGQIRGPDASGTNTAGVHFEIAGGPGTGNAVPGQVVARYPLITGSGTTLQSLSSGVYPLTTSLYTSTGSTTIANTVTETSIFTGMTSSAGSTLSIEGGISRAGTAYQIRAFGSLQTTGTPTFQVLVKFGGTTVGNTGAATMATVNGRYWLVVDLEITSIGATGSVTGFVRLDYSSVGAGAATISTNVGANVTTIDFTAAQTIDVTFTWGTASASNTVTTLGVGIKRDR